MPCLVFYRLQRFVRIFEGEDCHFRANLQFVGNLQEVTRVLSRHVGYASYLAARSKAVCHSQRWAFGRDGRHFAPSGQVVISALASLGKGGVVAIHGRG
jgi:hypothetical protein